MSENLDYDSFLAWVERAVEHVGSTAVICRSIEKAEAFVVLAVSEGFDDIMADGLELKRK